ncbi:MAG: dephospho-CoA kinase [Chloroflexota bacterium]
MIVIGLTGGIGSGKSTVSRILEELGARIIDMDKLGHELYRAGTPGWEEVVAEFGSDILQPNREVDRKKLGQIVFSDPEALKRLNRVMHPKIKRRAQEVLDEWRQQGVAVAVVEAAILIEASWASLTDEVWVTVASEKVAVSRMKERGFAPEQVLARVRSQMPVEEKAKQAQVVLHNDGNLAALRRQVEAQWQRLNPS